MKKTFRKFKKFFQKVDMADIILDEIDKHEDKLLAVLEQTFARFVNDLELVNQSLVRDAARRFARDAVDALKKKLKEM